MDECVACGARTDGTETRCVDCRETEAPPDGTRHSEGRRHATAPQEAASPQARAVGLLLTAAAALGGFVTAQSLQYVPQVLAFYAPVDSVGFLLDQTVTVTLLVAFAVMAKRLFDGTADVHRYGRLLQVLAAASLAGAVAVYALPDALTRWLPLPLDPAFVVLDVTAFHLYRDVFARELGVPLLGVLGASITFAAGTFLRRP